MTESLGHPETYSISTLLLTKKRKSERSYGILYYNTENRDSFDSNHAVIYKDKIDDLRQVFTDIREFYSSKGCRPVMFAALYAGKMIGITYGHISARACRGDYLLSKRKAKTVKTEDMSAG